MKDAQSGVFIDEARELLEEVERGLLALEEAPDDPEQVATLFRALHTLKGSGAMFGFEAIAAVAHEMEAVFELVRAARCSVSAELIDLALLALDHLKVLVAIVAGEEQEQPELTSLLDRIRSFCDRLGEAAPGPAAMPDLAAAGDTRTYRIRFYPPADIFQRGLNPLGFLRELYSLGDCLAVVQTGDIPNLDALDPQRCYLFWDLILTTDASVDTIRDIFIFIEDGCRLSITLIDEDGWPENAAEYKRLGEILVERGDLKPADLEQVLQERKRLGETLVAAGMVDSGRVDSALAEQQRIQELRRKRLGSSARSSLRVNSEKLDQLVNLVGELVTVQARLSQFVAQNDDPALVGIGEEVERLTWDLRDQILNIRMLPIGSTFGKFQRLARDLARELGKDVALVTTGAETELDKTVIERLDDPLVHLLRNAIDHGIESPERRLAAGKPAQGTVILSATHAGAYVLIEVRDDGAGLDREAIRRRALEQGLWSESGEYGDRELFTLIATPGFSTAGKVTSVSGRGVGMDAVRQAIEGLRGTVELSSRPGAGTTFTIRLPLTLAIIDGLLVNISGESYVFPMAMVEECVELHRPAAGKERRRNMATVRGELVPYVDLREHFDIHGEVPDIQQIVIADLDGQRIGFVVDYVVGEHQTVIKNLGQLYKEVRGISGATILGDGRVALIADLPALSQFAEAREKEQLERFG